MALVTTQSKPFIRLVELQEKSLNTLNSIKDSVAMQAEQKMADTQQLQLEQLKKLFDVQSDLRNYAKKQQDKQSKDMSDLTKSMKGWKNWGDKLRDMTRGVGEALNPAALQKKLFGAFNVGGVMNQKIKANEFVQKKKAMGDTRTDAQLNKDGKLYAGNQRKAMLAQDGIDRLKAKGASDAEIAASPVGKQLLAKRQSAQGALDRLDGIKTKDADNKMGGNDAAKISANQSLSNKGKAIQSATSKLSEKQAAKEDKNESTRQLQIQTGLLQTIALNTSSLRPGGSSAAGGKEDSKGGGMLDGVGNSMKGIGKGMASLGKGIGAGIGGLIGGIFFGIMKGIADGISLLGSGKVLKGVAVIGLLTGVLWGFTEVIKKWTDIDWEVIAKAGVALAGLVAIGAVAGAGVGGLLAGALGLAALGGAVWVIGKAMDSMGDGLQSFVDGIDRLSNINYNALYEVAKALGVLGAAFAAFGIGQAAAGLGNLVGRFLTIGSDSPVEQLVKIGAAGDGVSKAASGLDQLSNTMQKFSKLDSSAMKPIQDFPWEKATKFVAAGGAMNIDGAKVYNQSKDVADNKAAVAAQGNAPATPTVNTAIQNNTTNKQTVKLAVRNIESSQSKYLSTRY